MLTGSPAGPAVASTAPSIPDQCDRRCRQHCGPMSLRHATPVCLPIQTRRRHRVPSPQSPIRCAEASWPPPPAPRPMSSRCATLACLPGWRARRPIPMRSRRASDPSRGGSSSRRCGRPPPCRCRSMPPDASRRSHCCQCAAPARCTLPRHPPSPNPALCRFPRHVNPHYGDFRGDLSPSGEHWAFAERTTVLRRSVRSSTAGCLYATGTGESRAITRPVEGGRSA